MMSGWRTGLRALPRSSCLIQTQVRSASATSATLPVLSLKDWQGRGAAGREAFALQLEAACTKTGFFYLRDHGLDSLIEEGTAGLRDFFAQPREVKEKVAYQASRVYPPTARGWQEKEFLDPFHQTQGDTKQSFQMGDGSPQVEPPIGSPFRGPNLWPDDTVPLFRPRLSTLFSSLWDLSLDLCRAFAKSLGAQDEEIFARACSRDGGMPLARGLYYPEASEDPDEVGCSAHTDYGVLSLLHQTGPGLQVLRPDDSAWLDVPPLEGCLVCNMADNMERWTNGKYVSSVHRVIMPRGAPARYTYAFFLDTKFDTVVAPIEECCRDRSPRYEPLLAGQNKLQKTRIQYGENVQDSLHLFLRTRVSGSASAPVVAGPA